MSHHGHKDEMERFHAAHDAQRLPKAEAQFASAIKLIALIAGGNPLFDLPQHADAWLEQNGYDCEASRRRARERRAEQLDAELARLKAERDAL